MSPRRSKNGWEGAEGKSENMEEIDKGRRRNRNTGWPAGARKWCGVPSFSVTATLGGAGQTLDAAELPPGRREQRRPPVSFLLPPRTL